ncbi:hypothetical protein C8J57DRAFT_1384284 [Mycena rebaudengoi]|nr:hypothetical protein C8J57DRAFT_1385181 [Mycena rebaudengoi]KAJ7231949.1 hypothetical protein C8J57DRAFT_1384284 [Mycena rebaudengoi]
MDIQGEFFVAFRTALACLKGWQDVPGSLSSPRIGRYASLEGVHQLALLRIDPTPHVAIVQRQVVHRALESRQWGTGQKVFVGREVRAVPRQGQVLVVPKDIFCADGSEHDGVGAVTERERADLARDLKCVRDYAAYGAHVVPLCRYEEVIEAGRFPPVAQEPARKKLFAECGKAVCEYLVPMVVGKSVFARKTPAGAGNICARKIVSYNLDGARSESARESTNLCCLQNRMTA